eukprot:558196-Pyramimonas_sp.AAC.1
MVTTFTFRLTFRATLCARLGLFGISALRGAKITPRCRAGRRPRMGPLLGRPRNIDFCEGIALGIALGQDDNGEEEEEEDEGEAEAQQGPAGTPRRQGPAGPCRAQSSAELSRAPG